MAKARARTTTRKVKDRWKAKNWYTILAPSLFNNVPIADTLSEMPENLIGRITEVNLQDLTNDFRKSHIKLQFTIDKVEQNTAHTQLKGHLLTSDYLRRMIRRRKSRVDGVFTVETRDGALLRVKPFAIAEKRIKNSQKKILRNIMNEVIIKEGKVKTLNSFIKDCFEGKIGTEIYKNCKICYPVKRIEINKTEIIRLPTVIIEDEQPTEKTEEEQKESKEPKQDESKIPAEEKIIEQKQVEEKEIPVEEEPTEEDRVKIEKPKKQTKKRTTTKKKTTKKKTTKKKKETASE